MKLRTLSVACVVLLLAACSTPTPLPVVTPVSPTPAAEPLPEPVAPPPVKPSTPPARVVVPAPVPQLSDAAGRALLSALLPASMPGRKGWVDDISGAFRALKIPYTPENFCAAAAVIEQESSWQADPVVPGLPKIVWGKIEERAARYHLPMPLVKAGLLKPSRDGRSYKARIDSLRTETEMNALYEEMASEARSIGLPVGMHNPIRTGGPMQVSVEFAEGHVRAWPYPYTHSGPLRQEVFSRRGGTYFGIAMLLQYPAPYSDMVYRFADYNAGRYSSRNAAVQEILARLTGQRLMLDGDLLRYDENSRPSGQTSASQKALYTLAGRLGMNRSEIDRDLAREKYSDFADTRLYQRLYAIAGPAAPRARLPGIDLKSPKITRKLTTAWFAQRVDGRYRTCLARKP
ncbi:DUF1615 domain-containing protein [Paludibacterium paludis]|uniref:DUF1615 domain-containing protein n=1 Tax=Paludibacterium paludis TaxID=1225769 RepID=A0A918P4M2_9NEIS|nr:DUF1615 domain-containing protein [Paludibacterium paludis]GGY22728.1 hypothetical protein GCM10011289_28280 [Paludibacterium paludis]